MVDGDKYSLSFFGKVFSMVAILFNAISIGKPTTMEPNQYGAFFAIG